MPSLDHFMEFYEMAFRTHIEDAVRLLALRAPRHVAMLPAAGYVLFAALIVGVDVVGQWLGAGDALHFQLYGVNAEFAGVALAFSLIALFASRDGVARRNLALVALASAPLFAIYGCAQARAANPDASLFVASLLALALWTFAANWRAFAAARAARPALRSVLYTLAFWLVMIALPNWPIFPAENFSRARANFWEAARASAMRTADNKKAAAREAEWRAREQRFAAIEAAQPARVDAALAALRPRQSNKPNIFVVGVAGWSEQDVFEREIKKSMEILKTHFGADGHMVTLVNTQSPADTRPIASLQNISAVLRGVAAHMDRDRDALVLNMTSHGSTEGFSLENDQLVSRTLSPSMLKSMLDAAGIRNRIVIVSACYSGVFTKSFDDPSSVVITAAAADRTSFGCENGREWTYFGEAFFEKGLREDGALKPAFAKAQGLIDKREADEKLKHSLPQIFVGEEFRRRFPALVGEGNARAAQLDPKRAP